MTSQDHSKLIRDFFQAVDSQDIDKALTFLAPDAVFKVMSMPDQPFKGTQAIRENLQTWSSAFPNMSCAISNILSSGDQVVVEYLGKATHEGPLPGPTGTLQATHRRIEVPACDVFNISNGKIMIWNCYWQSELMLNQLGAMPQMKAAA